METEVGGDKLKEATIPGRGKKRPPSPASSPSDDDCWEFSDDDCWEFSDEELEEEEENDDEDVQDTATSRAKKSESPVLKAMNKYMSDIAKIQAQRNEYFRQRLAAKQQKEDAKREKIRIVQQLARECGVEETNRQMWFAVNRICNEENSMEFFIGTSTPGARLAIIEHYAKDGNSARDGENSDESSDEELFRLLVEDDDTEFMYSMLLFAIEYDKYYNRAKRRKQRLLGVQRRGAGGRRRKRRRGRSRYSHKSSQEKRESSAQGH